jgi:hypothetical protein
MCKKVTLPIVFMFMTIAAFAQTAPQLEKTITDPKRAENEAKADVYLQRQPVISNGNQKLPDADTKATMRKKRSCGRKTS